MSYTRWNERPSPKAKRPQFLALQILGRLRREHEQAMLEALDELGLCDTDLDEVQDALIAEMDQEGTLEECGGCGSYHRPDFRGDCRNDDERFPF